MKIYTIQNHWANQLNQPKLLKFLNCYFSVESLEGGFEDLEAGRHEKFDAGGAAVVGRNVLPLGNGLRVQLR